MKKKILLSVSVIVAIMLIIGGCSNSSDDKSEGRGVLGQISGVVYDTVKAQPLKDVVVELGTTSTKTDASGAFLFKDVGVGTYTVTFFKEGYQFRSKNVDVNPKLYIDDDDPFRENDAFEAQITAIEKWIEMQKLQGTPVFVTPDGASVVGDWVYTAGGNFTFGDGNTVTVKQNDNKQFEVKEYKLNYTYSKSLPLYLTGMAPLTGAIKAQIKLFNKPQSETLIEKLEDAVLIADGVEFWFVDKSNVGFGNDYGNGDTESGIQPPYETAVVVKSDAYYGPFKTAGGIIQATGLPVGVKLDLVSNGFSQDGYYYKIDTEGSAIYTFNFANVAFSEAGAIFTPQNNTVDAATKVQNYTDVGTVYKFAEGNYAIITAISAGNPTTPLAPTAAITLDFSEPIDPATFSANLVTIDNSKFGAGIIPLAATWTTTSKVSLKPANTDGKTGYLSPNFPYSDNESENVGNIVLEGKAVSGAKIYAISSTVAATAAKSIPVFTTEGLKLIGIDLNPTGIPARLALSASAIKLTFSKPISAENSLFWVANKAVKANVSGSSVFIYTDLLISTGAGVEIEYEVYSAADPYGDNIGRTYVKYGSDDSDKLFTKTAVIPWILKETNLYASGVLTSSGADANFPVASAITLTFDRDLPTALDQLKVSLSKVNNASLTDSIALAKAAATNKLTITPTIALDFNQTYYLNVQVVDSDATFTIADLVSKTVAAVDGANDAARIVFKTAVDPDGEVTAQAIGNNSATTGFTVSGGNIIGGTIVAGKTYYVQFNGGTLKYLSTQWYTGNASDDPPTKNAIGSAQAVNDLSIVITITGNVMGITVNAAKPSGSDASYQLKTSYTSVGLKYNIGTKYESDPDGAPGVLDRKNGTINTASGTFSISGLTVTVP